MSAHYHAYQARGFLFSNYEVQCEQFHRLFRNYDPSRIARILNLDFDEKFLCLSYFGISYRLRLADGILEKQADTGWTDQLYFNEAMSIYHHLQYTKDFPHLTGEWIPTSEIEGASIRNTRLPDPLLAPFARQFSGKCAELALACETLGGKKLNQGDVSYEFFAFPQVPLRLIFWDADEDFPAQAQVLTDRGAADYMHFETIGCVVSDLLEKLENNSCAG